MAVVHTWPLASDPAHLSRLDNDDAALNTWVISWVAHALPRDPLNLFNAPIFYPEQNTLAYSEHLFVQSVMGAPLLWAGASPVLVHNLLLIAGFALSGWAMSLLVTRWTGNAAAGIVAGLAYAFNAHTLTRFPHLQAHHVQFFPLMLYAFDRVLTDRSKQHAALLAAAFVLQALCSNYLLVFSLFALTAMIAVRTDAWHRSSAVALLIAGTISVVALIPFLWPYYEVSREQGLARSLDEVARYSAGWRDYLVTGGRLHYAWWSHSLFEGRTALFPGVTALVLAGVGLMNWRDRRVQMTFAIGIIGFALSFGPALPGYAVLHDSFPLLGGIRNAARFGWLLLAAVAILAGFGAARIKPRWAIVAVCVLVTAEAIRTPIGYTRFEGLPRIYDRIAAEPNVVLAEFPFYSGRSVSDNGPYVLANSRYLRPLVNGYSGFQPPTFEERGRALNSFPAQLAVDNLKVLGVTHVTVHREAFADRFGEATLNAIDTVTELELVDEADGVRLYRLR
ncbi:MAG TPA: hypothetical protein VF239_19145 [Vicinamibacterales bacterium]